MNKNSNIYIIIYASVLVILVAAVLAFASVTLKDRQQANILVEKKQAILTSIGQAKDLKNAPQGKDKYIDAEYQKYIVATYFVNKAGESTETDAKSALDALENLRDIFAMQEAMPLFKARNEDGSILYVVPVSGTGLWGPIWGYVALKEDLNTVEGAVFDHKGETPGLGAEISQSPFQQQFVGKKIFEGARFMSITLTKGEGSSAGNDYAVDAVSGGTLTSNGVRDMLRDCLGAYTPFFEIMRASQVDSIQINQ